MESIFVDFMGQLIHEFWNLTKNNVFFPLINNTVDIFVCIFLGSTKLRTHWDCFNEQSKKIGINEFKNLHSVILNVQIYVCFLFELMYCERHHTEFDVNEWWLAICIRKNTESWINLKKIILNLAFLFHTEILAPNAYGFYCINFFHFLFFPIRTKQA